MTTATETQTPLPVWDEPHEPDPARIPAYDRTGTVHSHIQPFEAMSRLSWFLGVLSQRQYPELHRQLQQLVFRQDTPRYNGKLTHEQARLVAKMARRFIREGDRRAADAAELTLNASGLMLDEVLPPTPAQQIQADQEARRIQDMRRLMMQDQAPPF